MIKRFKDFTKYVSLAYKYLIKIKSEGIKEFGLKGSHVMCLFYIGESENGLTATKLCQLCCEDKAAISRTLNELEIKGYTMTELSAGRKYRARVCLTDEGIGISCHIDKLIEGWVTVGGEGLTEEQRAGFYNALNLIAGNLKKHHEKN